MEHGSTDVVAEFSAQHPAWRSRMKLMRDGVFVGGGARPNGRWEYVDEGRVLVLAWFHWPKDVLQQTPFGFANAKLRLETPKALPPGSVPEQPPVPKKESQTNQFEITRGQIEAVFRRLGISALIRYYNDRHTLLPCLESVRGLFDEIVIVHQPCDDFSEDLLKQIREGQVPSLKGEKISVYPYPWFVYPPHYPTAWPKPSLLQTMANYSNYGLAKITTSHYMCIDADQIYFNAVLKEMLAAGIRDGVDYAAFGINIFITEAGSVIVNPKGVFNGLPGEHRMMSFARKPFFNHTPPYEVLQAQGLKKQRHPQPAWLHVTQMRRPARLLPGAKAIESYADQPAIVAALANGEYQTRIGAAKAAVKEAVNNSITFPWVDEFLVVGNSRIDRTEKHGAMIDSHPFVVRFVDGAIPERLVPEKDFLGERTDLYCLNGWLFHPAAHLKGKRVMFTRPLADRANLSHGLFVSEQKRDHIAKETSNLCHIPKRVFYDFFREYQHTNPTSGLIFVYYVRQVLKKRVKLVNFRFERGLPSFHNNLQTGDCHHTDRECEILTAILNSPL